MADISIQIGYTKYGNMTLIDNVTGSPVTATFSNQAVGANSAPQFAAFQLDPTNSNRVKCEGVAAGSGTVVINAHAAYTDPGDGSSQSVDVSVTKNFTVVGSPNGVTFDVVFT